jgi:hypothetical protein
MGRLVKKALLRGFLGCVEKTTLIFIVARIRESINIPGA